MDQEIKFSDLQKDSRIPNMYQQNMAGVCLEWLIDETYIVYGTLFLSIAKFLSAVKTKDHKNAIVFEDLKGNFKMAGVVQHHENNEETDDPGNWSFIITFDKEDVSDCIIHKFNDVTFYMFANRAIFEYYNYGFEHGDRDVYGLLMGAVDVLIDWLDKNAEINGAVELEGFFQARATIKDGIKEFSVVPSAELKRIIKDDAKISK